MSWNSWSWTSKSSPSQYDHQDEAWYSQQNYAGYKGNKSNSRSHPYLESPSGKGKGKNSFPSSSYEEPPTSLETPILPTSFTPNDTMYDSKELHGLTLNKKIEASHWSRKRSLAGRDVYDIKAHELMYHGAAEWSLRILSHGRFISTVPARSVAESVFVAHLFALVRKHHLDLDGAAEIAWVQQNPQANLPSKTSDVAALYHPLLTQLLQVVQKYAPVESSSKATQEMVALKTQLAKREQQLRAQGVEISPAKPSSAAASEDVPAGSNHALPLQASEPQEEPQQGALDRLEIIEQDVLKTKTKNLSGHSFEAVQTWVKTFKKTLGGQKFEELQALVDEIQKLASDKASAMPKERPKELAVKFGIPISIANWMGIKSLSAVMATATMFAA